MEKPECISIIICDDVYRDEITKKLLVVGTFNQVNAPSLPHRLKFNALFTLTNGQGRFDLSVRVEHAASGNALMELSGPAELTGPLEMADINVVLDGLELPEAGKYWLTINVDGQIIAQRPFVVKLLEPTEE